MLPALKLMRGALVLGGRHAAGHGLHQAPLYRFFATARLPGRRGASHAHIVSSQGAGRGAGADFQPAARRAAPAAAAAAASPTDDFLAPESVTFASLGLSPAVAQALVAAGYARPSLAQVRLPVWRGRGRARTAAF